ncbi:transglycosylase SLT domain-containing protein [Ferrimonas senticii]|uniref:transglycosylase SLT domain-containing protein n=1 Tax=Ferrimonas senticii TaxID=394566 RepID=UPI0006856601|nr:transporter substrate-binding domain-containing protein [Ferrimonas senticii]
MAALKASRSNTLMIALALAFVAPTSANQYGNAPAALNEPPLARIWPLQASPKLGDLDAMIERGEIRILTTFTWGWYYIDRGQPQGFTYQLTQLFERYLQQRLGAKAKGLKVTVIPVRRDQLLAHLQLGYGDLIFANLTITEARQAQIDFSEPYQRNVSEIWVSGPAQAAPGYWTQVSGKQVVVRRESSYYQSLQQLNQQLTLRGYPKVEVIAADPRLEDQDLLQMVADGFYPATVVDSHVSQPWLANMPTLIIKPQVAVKQDQQLAYGLRQHSPQLKALIDGFVARHSEGSLAFNSLRNHHLQNQQWLPERLQQPLFAEGDKLINLFKRFGEQYQLDWLLLLAFAYQESKLDQQARSPSGAVGIMQVLPATAADPAVAITRIDKLENNIEAGAKYLAHLKSSYFADPKLDDFSRTLFAMAAYNAGPNRINRLRQLAWQRGLDRNRWFNNVEDIVAAEVGREPVNYVANIYRNYIIYKRIHGQWQQRQQLRQNLQPRDAQPLP